MPPTPAIDSLVAYLLGGKPHPLAPTLAYWLAERRRFAVFAETYRDKIRKKLRLAAEDGAMRDVALELHVAFLLLNERALSVEYEPRINGQTRCPDFAVSFSTRPAFMLEVTRVRTIVATPGVASPAITDRLTDTIGGKLGQLVPQRANALLIGTEVPELTPATLQHTIAQMQQRAEHNDAALFQRHHFRDRADFFAQFERLHLVCVRLAQPESSTETFVWRNPRARHPLAPDALAAISRSLGA